MRLHPDIKRDLDAMGRVPKEVIDPSPGLWGGDPIPGLVTIVYLCPDKTCPYFSRGSEHTHRALYGPPCWTNPDTGKFEAIPGAEGMTLYAD